MAAVSLSMGGWDMKTGAVVVVAILTMSAPGTLQAQALRDLSAKKVIKPLQIKRIARPRERKERSGGVKWIWYGKWVQVDVRNNSKEAAVFKAEVLTYNKEKEFVKKFSKFDVDKDEREVDPVTSTINGKRTGTLWFRLKKSFVSVNDIKYYEVRLILEGEVVDRKTYPPAFLKELLRREKE